jgi:gamma-glutamylcyclotransferase (GGCT)/AIG2-like uncharacterized protein YtfP
MLTVAVQPIVTQYIFLYGTLLPGHAPAQIASAVGRLRRVGRGTVQGILYDLGRYPGAVLGKTGSLIQGEVFELPDDPEILHRLDAFEGFDPDRPESSEFVRREWPVILSGGKKIICWVYAYNRDPGAAPRIADGDFSKSRKSRA